MTDENIPALVARLNRWTRNGYVMDLGLDKDLEEAAAALEALQKTQAGPNILSELGRQAREIERLRAALKFYEMMAYPSDYGQCAREALKSGS
jgi:hypothetical protein